MKCKLKAILIPFHPHCLETFSHFLRIAVFTTFTDFCTSGRRIPRSFSPFNFSFYSRHKYCLLSLLIFIIPGDIDKNKCSVFDSYGNRKRPYNFTFLSRMVSFLSDHNFFIATSFVASIKNQRRLISCSLTGFSVTAILREMTSFNSDNLRSTSPSKSFFLRLPLPLYIVTFWPSNSPLSYVNTKWSTTNNNNHRNNHIKYPYL